MRLLLIANSNAQFGGTCRKARECRMKVSAHLLGAALACPEMLLARDSYSEPEAALTFEAAYTAEGWRNVRGGISSDGAFLDNLDLVATLDAGHLGLTATTLSIAALYNNHETFSDKVGDLQAVSNIDTDGSLRLYEAWLEHNFDRASVKLGLMDLNSEFDVNETGSLFINSSHGIGPDFSQVGENGPSIFPITGLGARVQVDLGGRTTLRLGAFEGTPGDPDRPRDTTFHLDDDEGHLFVVQLNRVLTEDSLVALGVWRHTGRVYPMEDAEIAARRHSTGAYALIEGIVTHLDTREVRAFLRAGVADAQVHQISRYQGAGLTVSGPLFSNGQRDEMVGLAVGAITNGGSFRRLQRATGSPVNSHEVAIELTYQVQLTPSLVLQPEIQYIVNPGTDPRLHNSLVVGLRLTFKSGSLALKVRPSVMREDEYVAVW